MLKITDYLSPYDQTVKLYRYSDSYKGRPFTQSGFSSEEEAKEAWKLKRSEKVARYAQENPPDTRFWPCARIPEPGEKGRIRQLVVTTTNQDTGDKQEEVKGAVVLLTEIKAQRKELGGKLYNLYGPGVYVVLEKKNRKATEYLSFGIIEIRSDGTDIPKWIKPSREELAEWEQPLHRKNRMYRELKENHFLLRVAVKHAEEEKPQAPSQSIKSPKPAHNALEPSEVGTSRPRGPKPTREVSKALELICKGHSTEVVKTKLINLFGKTSWKDFDPRYQEANALNAIKAAYKRIQRAENWKERNKNKG